MAMKKYSLCILFLYISAVYFTTAETIMQECVKCGGRGSIICGVCAGKGILPGAASHGIRENKRCPNCNGRGIINCTECDGRGWESFTYQNPPKQEKYPCANCNGRGNVECRQCKGGGKILCKSCFGQGYRITNYVTGEKEPCNRCDASGYQSCHVCGGTGRTDCKSCNGMGYFIER